MTPTVRPGLPAALLVWLAPAIALASAAGGEHHIDWVYVGSLFANFILFIILMTVLLRKPLRGYFSGRADRVAQAMNQAEEARKKAEDTLRDYEAKIDELLATRDEVLAKARHDAEAEKERIVANARLQAERLLADSEKTVAAEYENARVRLADEATRLIGDEAARLLSAAVKSADADRLADDYIDMLREVKP
jgi:F-type H+-transporting ATPase subunit b